MKIHIVTPGDTIYSISKQYGIPEIRLMTDNFLNPTCKLIEGQSLLISHPHKTCPVRGGDTLESIAKENNVSVLSILQNNPQIFTNSLMPSQTLNISFIKDNARKLAVSAYTGTLDVNELEKYLPYISILSVQNNAYINGDSILVSKSAPLFATLSKKHHAVPILVIDSFNEKGKVDGKCISEILDNPERTEKFINNILNIVIENGFSGIELNASGLNEAEKYRFTDMFLALFSLCRENNLLCTCPAVPMVDFDLSDDNLMDISDYIPLWSYIWDDSSKASRQAPIEEVEKALNNKYVNKYLAKTLLGISTFAVDYAKVNGEFRKSIVCYNDFLNYIKTFSSFRFYRDGESPVIEYEERGRKNGLEHILYFEDVASISTKLDLVDKYDLYGINIMSIDYKNPILWQILNQRYDILKF